MTRRYGFKTFSGPKSLISDKDAKWIESELKRILENEKRREKGERACKALTHWTKLEIKDQ
jgi:hypothetical protein